MQGYSLRMAEGIKQADESLLGVQLGRACLARDIPVTEIARHFGVSRQAVYDWFLGASIPREGISVRIREYLAQLA